MKGKQKLVKKLKTIKKVEPKEIDLTTLKLSQLRKLYPHIKATSTKEFLEELAKEKDVQVKN